MGTLIFLYIIIFTMGTLFGSFSKLAIYRIPKKKNITNERSFCPNCKHKLGFFDLIPVWSYIFLKGKCRYCGKKISKSYFLVEILVGIASVGIFSIIAPTIETLDVIDLTEYLYQMIFISTLVIIGGIDKDYKKVNKKIIFLGSIIGFVHIIYLYILKECNLNNMYKYVIYFAILCVLSVISQNKKYIKYKYLIEILMICIYMNMFVTSETFLITAIFTIISLTINIIVRKRKAKGDQSDILANHDANLDIPIAYYLCISNIIAMIFQAIPVIIL